MKISSFLKKTVLFLSIMTCFRAFAYDDVPSGIIKGKITTSDGKPAAYISVTIDKLHKGALTDEDGEYIIKKVPVGTWTVKVSSVGVNSQESTVTVEENETVNADFQVEQNAQQLAEVVVNAQRQKINASDYTAKLPLKNLENSQVYSTVSKELISGQLLTSVDDAMRNVTGLQTMWNATARAGDGGSYYNSRGFTLQSNLRNGIAGIISNTADAANVESIEVLKGPSATLFGNVLTSYGGLINRVTKKPYDYFGGEVSVMAGSYNFSRGALDINTPLNNAKTVLFRLNTAYNYQGNFQTEGFARRVFVAPSLLIKATDRLTFSLDAELSYGKNIGQQALFFYFPASQLGYTNANQVKVDYKNSYMGDGLSQKATSGNYFANATYKISKAFTSSTNVSYSHSYSGGFDPYFFLVPNSLVNPSDNGASTYLARADQTTFDNSHQNDFEAQENLSGDFNIGSMRNRMVIGLDYTRVSQNIHFKSNTQYFDIVPTNVAGFDYNGFNGTSMANYYQRYNGNDSAVQGYPEIGTTNDYSAYVSDILNLLPNLELLAAVRADHFDNNSGGQERKQTVWSPKFGIVYQPVKDKVALFANYQNSFTNGSLYSAYDEAASNHIVSKLSKPEQANQWEGGIKTDLLNNKLNATLSYYYIKVKDVLRPDMRDPANTSIQDGTQRSRGVEFDMDANPFSGFNILGGLSYNDSKMLKASSDVEGRRPSTASSPWLAHWWLSYELPQNIALKGLSFGFGGNYASDNKIVNSASMGQFTLPAYTVLNAAVSYEFKRTTFALKMDNLTNKHYWIGFTTMNPQMLRQFVASVSCKF